MSHPPIDPERLATYRLGDAPFVTASPEDRHLNRIAIEISEEVAATKCDHIRFSDGLLVLTFERWERGIISLDERDRLLRRLYT